MDKESYLTSREELVLLAEEQLANNEVEIAHETMNQVDALDEEWQTYCAEIANNNALNGTAPVQNIANPGAETTALADETLRERSAKIIETFNNNSKEVTKMNILDMKPAEVWKTDEYKTAWAKTLMGKPLTEDENTIYRMVNEDFEHTTDNTGSVVPDTVASGIWEEVADMYPYWADITKTNVNGNLTIVQANESSEAAWYDEATETETGKETFQTIQLQGCELSRAIAVSWKLKEMAIADFIPYIQRRMAEAMGAALGYGVVQGKGADAEKPEPMGIVTALEADKNQVVSGDASYATITKARGKIKSGYSNGIAVYANSETIWDSLANICDDDGHPLFIHDVASEQGVFRILGMIVKEDASVPTGKVLLSNAARGYQANVNRQVEVVTEDHARQRVTDYVGYAIVDGAPLTLKAHSLIDLGE